MKLYRGPYRRNARRDPAMMQAGIVAGPVSPPSCSAPPERPFAALDLGTNNCRLLIAVPEPPGFRVIDGFSRIVRLGEGLERRGRLGRKAMERALGALTVCSRKIHYSRVGPLRAVATEACRQAGNCEDFLDRVRSETGLRLEIITPREEAALMLAGCAPLLVPDRTHALVFDIGGGSTEIVWAALGGADDPSPSCRGHAESVRRIDCLSVPIGVVNLSERHGRNDMDAAAYEGLVAQFAERIADFARRHEIAAAIAEDRVQMLGSCGTVTTLAGLNLGLSCYDRRRVDGVFLDFAEIRDVTARLLAMDHAGRAREGCIGHARADLVLAGCAILDAICRTWPVGRLRVADRGLRDGILRQLMRAAASQPVGA